MVATALTTNVRRITISTVSEKEMLFEKLDFSFVVKNGLVALIYRLIYLSRLICSFNICIIFFLDI